MPRGGPGWTEQRIEVSFCVLLQLWTYRLRSSKCKDNITEAQSRRKVGVC